MAQITVISGVERRRRWSDDQKLALVEAAIVPGASVALMPHLGMIRTGFLFGLMNVGVALALLFILPAQRTLWREKAGGILVALVLLGGFVVAERLQRWAEVAAYEEPVIYAVSTPYQRIVLTRRGGDLRLFLNGNLQFSSRDEYRYHEALVQPAIGRVAHPANVLILGGGDGLAAREVLRYPGVARVTLVDLDPAMTRLFARTPVLAALNRGSLADPRLTVVNADAFRWVRAARGRYDAIVVDFPDPVDFSVGKLYTESFYRELARILAPGGVAVVQATSPLVAPNAFWTVSATIAAAGLATRAYHAYVPSFGEWGFVLAAHGRVPAEACIIPGGRFLTATIEPRLFDFPPDMARRPVPVNRLDNQALVREFADEWAAYEG